MDDRAFVLFPTTSGVLGRCRAGALLALLPLAAAAQDDSAVIEWHQEATPNIIEFRIYYGRAPQSLTGLKLVLDPEARTATVDGLADGTWYFAVVAVSPNAVESEPSGLICVVIPSGSCDAPLDGDSRPPQNPVVPTSDIRVSINNINARNGQFDLSIEGNGPVMIELADGLLFDWCTPGGLSGLPTVTPTTPSLGDRDDDGNRRPTVTFAGPIARTRCDGDGAAGTNPGFGGATITVGRVSKPLVESSGTWSAQFP